MNAVNAVQLFILVWTFTAVCQADDDISVSCDDVTGSVKKEVTLTCSVSLQKNKCCIKNNKFQYKNSTMCPQVLPEHSCEQRKIFTCSYTPPTAMTEKFTFFVQASCGWKKPEFTVNTTVYLRHMNPENPSRTSPPETAAGLEFEKAVTLMSGFAIILIIIIMTIIYKTKPNFTKHSGSKNKMFVVVRHDEYNSNHPEDVI
ncbi:uncharacterized protein LOC127157487 [Labeo rohita]|uniref:uncharacterized protein LOC127157487 n=1 Tax=Labeo rohita TaxID=84645 RepID=UPI0021E21444|nr:uncharacterized protein LOC127157487 [Labeo rohita]